ncbi:hypothetical protein D3C84_563600 [compost metagenome]
MSPTASVAANIDPATGSISPTVMTARQLTTSPVSVVSHSASMAVPALTSSSVNVFLGATTPPHLSIAVFPFLELCVQQLFHWRWHELLESRTTQLFGKGGRAGRGVFCSAGFCGEQAV